LNEAASLNGIVIAAKLNRNNAKKHLRKLEAAKLIRANQSKFVKYSITKDGISWLKRYKSLAMSYAEEAAYNRLDF
jgi:predicted transcriptional regulator